jgi:hypothetical protein
MPVRNRNSQNTGAVYSTIVSKPLRVSEPSPTSASATTP